MTPEGILKLAEQIVRHSKYRDHCMRDDLVSAAIEAGVRLLNKQAAGHKATEGTNDNEYAWFRTRMYGAITDFMRTAGSVSDVIVPRSAWQVGACYPVIVHWHLGLMLDGSSLADITSAETWEQEELQEREYKLELISRVAQDSVLSDKYKVALKLTLEGQGQEDVAALLDITSSRVSQMLIEVARLVRLRLGLPKPEKVRKRPKVKGKPGRPRTVLREN